MLIGFLLGVTADALRANIDGKSNEASLTNNCW